MQKKYFMQVLLAGLALLWFTGCTDMVEPPEKSEPSALPSITKAKTGQWHPGKFVWHDLLTDDMEAARKFYGDVFGWRFETKRDYTQIYNQKELIGGIMQVVPSDDQKAKAVWLPSISVANIDKSVKYLTSQKGQVLKGPLVMKKRGKGVLVSDPHGAHVVLLRAKSGDPKDKKAQIGDWLWNELWTNKPKESYTFYRHIGGYDGSEMRDGYHVLKKKSKWRAGIREIDKDEFKARWVPAIRVADLKETMSKVKASDGEVLVSPHEALANGNVALIADNRGAAVIIQYWEEGGE